MTSHQGIERQVRAGIIRRDVYHNHHYPGGVSVYSVDTHKAHWNGNEVYGNSFFKRKLENALVLLNPMERVKVQFV